MNFSKFYELSIRELIREKLISFHLRFLNTGYKRRPVPLLYWLSFHSLMKIIFPSSDPIFPPHTLSQSNGADLKIPQLRHFIKNELLGTWALDVNTITFLWEALLTDRPEVIIECGAGISSLVLANYAKFYCPPSKGFPLVFSLEQDMQIKKAVEKRLDELSLDEYIKILYTPITKQGKYKLYAQVLWKELGSRKADLLLIDGPAGPSGCREWTIPLLAQFCRPGTKWYLDDSFRDAELRILRSWQRSTGIYVSGIHPFGKGLGSGIIYSPNVPAQLFS